MSVYLRHHHPNSLREQISTLGNSLLHSENPRGLTPEQVAELEARFPRD